MLYELLIMIPIGFLFIKTINDLYNHIDKIENNTKQSYNYLQLSLKKNINSLENNTKQSYNYLDSSIRKLDSLFKKFYNYDHKLNTINTSRVLDDIDKIKYNIDKLCDTENKNNLQTIDKINNINNIIEEISEDIKIMKSIYSLTFNELKNELKDNIIDISNVIEEKYNNLNNAFIYEKMSNELSFENILNKIKKYNNDEYTITFSNINQIIKDHNIENIGTKYLINITKNNYRNINKNYSTCNYKCNNVINYKISIYHDNEKIIISKPHNNNYLLLNISYNVALTFYNNEIIGSNYDMCYIVPNLDIDNEYPKILQNNELEEYNKSIKLLNDNYEIVKQEINNFVKKELEKVSLEPFITNYLL